ncbi:unnamed protein product [Eruca vesicaria subsp. sativa]|uniref:Uncharacterized protein n=1 Tax=Eruca vesicaria subsp. sativa TaxID=29727 RepID=A0ABC8JK74_ERUVS|nr:unnamed protein product [Eruca vesicaria subsp. sativa]
MSVTRVAWSPDGNFIGKFRFMHCEILIGLWSQSLFNAGVAYKKHLIHLYAFSGPNDLRQHAEVNAHVGAVNDLAFANPNRQLCVVTCGDDKLIKVWDVSGRKHFTFEGHDAHVYSICPHHKENIQFIFSMAIDGKIKSWLYDNMGSRVDYDAPGKWCTTMLYSADGTRLFSCATSKDGDFFLVEWNESEGSIKRTYLGFQKKLAGNFQFDTSKNHFLAVGEDGQIKFWDMDNINVLTSTDAKGGLPALPHLRFNREGNILSVTTADNGFKILANQAGFRFLRAVETSAFEKMRTPADSPLIKAVMFPNFVVYIFFNHFKCFCCCGKPLKNGVDPPEPRIGDSTDKPKPWQLAEILEPSRGVVRLLYTNSGTGILALGFNGIQRLWKWIRNEQNPSGKATAAAAPQHWQPNSGLLMTNDVSGVNLEEANSCIALSKNDSYVISAAGGKVSLFNMMTFKVKSKLKGHLKRITGLAFSTTLKILVSSGADAQICFWSIDNGDTRVQFHVDQILFDADTLRLRCRISPSAYLPQGNQGLSPLVVAAHPQEPNQFAVGLNDGSVKVIEPTEAEGKWGMAPPPSEAINTSPSTTSNQTPEQLQI